VPTRRAVPCCPAACSWLQDQLPPEVLERCYFFNTFFFKKLMEDQGEGGRQRLRG
jgi:hypothetical protein